MPTIRGKQISVRHEVDSILALLLRNEGVPLPVREFMFHPSRKWRLDFAWPDAKLALEVEGGAWINGRHNRASGWIKDVEKYNALAVAGWRLLRCTPKQLHTDATAQMIRRALTH